MCVDRVSFRSFVKWLRRGPQFIRTHGAVTVDFRKQDTSHDVTAVSRREEMAWSSCLVFIALPRFSNAGCWEPIRARSVESTWITTSTNSPFDSTDAPQDIAGNSSSDLSSKLSTSLPSRGKTLLNREKKNLSKPDTSLVENHDKVSRAWFWIFGRYSHVPGVHGAVRVLSRDSRFRRNFDDQVEIKARGPALSRCSFTREIT